MKKEKISIVIPCYNSEESIEKVSNTITKLFKLKPDYDYEIILINDGSKDNTWEMIKKIAQRNKKIISINLSKNFGQHNAMMAGYKHVTGDIIVGLDDDGENNPEEIFDLIDKLNKGYDCVCADYDEHDSKIRSFGTKINEWMAYHFIQKPKGLTITSFYAVRRFVINQVNNYNNPYPYVAGLFLQASKNWGTVKLKREERICGKSNYTIRKLISLWVNGFTSFSIKPLRISIFLGFGFAILGFLTICFMVIRKIIDSNILIGYTSIVSCVLLIGGIILIVLGMIGEYIGRIYLSMNNSPQYVIKDIVKSEEK